MKRLMVVSIDQGAKRSPASREGGEADWADGNRRWMFGPAEEREALPLLFTRVASEEE